MFDLLLAFFVCIIVCVLSKIEIGNRRALELMGYSKKSSKVIARNKYLRYWAFSLKVKKEIKDLSEAIEEYLKQKKGK